MQKSDRYAILANFLEIADIVSDDDMRNELDRLTLKTRKRLNDVILQVTEAAVQVAEMKDRRKVEIGIPDSTIYGYYKNIKRFLDNNCEDQTLRVLNIDIHMDEENKEILIDLRPKQELNKE